MIERTLYKQIWQELSAEKAMIFIAGPRQSGKTTFSRWIASKFTNQTYFNWDLVSNKKLFVEKPAFFEETNRKDDSIPLVILDEIHKYRKWKNYLKGVYDEFSNRYKFLVLGSGRLNVFERGGDSLAGRYFPFTLWPMTLAELSDQRLPFEDFMKNPLALGKNDPAQTEIWQLLSELSGFPEPYVSGKKTSYRRWSNNYASQLVREDIRNMVQVNNVDAMEMLFSILPSKVGNPLSLLSLARDLQISFNSVRSWLNTFESFFLIFRISPWTKKVARAITKEQKLYLLDYARIASEAAKFENMAALELLRAVSNWNELGLGNFSLHYLRNKEKEEVDFLVAENHLPKLLIEVKTGDEKISKSLTRFQSALNVPAIQLVNKPDICKLISQGKNQVLLITASRWLASLP